MPTYDETLIILLIIVITLAAGRLMWLGDGLGALMRRLFRRSS
jgi:hypothetical protein